jgi:hypothetical protein
MFRQDFTCPALLKDLRHFTHTGLSPAMAGLSRPFCLSSKTTGLFRVRSPLLAESLLMSFPPGTEMFQFPGFASSTLCIHVTIPLRVGCPIRISTDQSLLAAPRGFSQRATSFIASWCQGIHRMPFLYSISRTSRTEVPEPHHAQKPSSDPSKAHRTMFSHGRTRGEPRSLLQSIDRLDLNHLRHRTRISAPFLEENDPSGSISSQRL